MSANLNRFVPPSARDDDMIRSLIDSHIGRIDFAEVKLMAEGRMDEILDALGAEYRQVRDELEVINPTRSDTDFGSFKFNVVKGVGAEFAEGDEGLDCIAFIAYYCEIEPLEAAKLITVILSKNNEDGASERRARHAANQPQWLEHEAVDEPPQVQPVPADAPPMPTSFAGLGTPSQTYIYRDADGNATGAILRFDLQNGKKDIRPLTLRQYADGLIWKMKGWDGLRPLYNLDQIAAKPEAPIIIGEGEKTAEALRTLCPDHVATTVMGGANAVAKADLSPLYGRTVYIWPDHDEAGYKYAKDIVQRLLDVDPDMDIYVLEDLKVQPKEGHEGILVETFVPPKGYDAADALADGWTADHALVLLNIDHFVHQTKQVVEDELSDDNEDGLDYKRITTPTDIYELNDDGVFVVKFKDGEESGMNWISSWIRVRGLARNEADRGWGVIVDFRRPDGVLDYVFLSNRELMSVNGDGGLALLADLGVNISSQPSARTSLANYLKASPNNEGMTYTTEKTGWVEPCAFMAGNQLVGHPQHKWVNVGEHRNTAVFETGGELEGWQENIAALCVGNSRLALAVCVALAGPIQKILGAEGGGIHLRGNSSIGKSVALAVAGSVWSPPSALSSWRTTDNAMEATALARNDIALTLDEMSQAAPNHVGEIAYMLGNGQGKARSSVGGGVRKINKFRCQVISTGEVNLESHMRQAGIRALAGQEVRFLDIPADAGLGYGLFECLHDFQGSGQLAEALRELAGQHYGHAGIRLLESLCDELRYDQAGLLRFLQDKSREFAEQNLRSTDSGQVRRVANRFGLYAAAGEYAIKIGLLPWPEGEALRCASVCYRAWLEERGGPELREKIRLKQQVRHFLETHGTSRFEPMHIGEISVGERPRTNNQAGFFENLDPGIEYFVYPEVFKTEICAGFDPTQAVKWLVEDGWLKTDSQGRGLVNKRLPGIGQKRMYHLTIRASSDSEQVEPVAPQGPSPEELEARMRYDL